MAFETARLKEELLLPAAGALTFLTAELLAASIDSKKADARPYAQEGVTAVALVGSLYAIGSRKVTKFAVGALLGSMVGIAANALKWGYDTVTKQATHINPADLAATIAPRRVGQLPAGGGKGLKLTVTDLSKGTKQPLTPVGAASSMEI